MQIAIEGSADAVTVIFPDMDSGCIFLFLQSGDFLSVLIDWTKAVIAVGFKTLRPPFPVDVNITG